MLTKDEIYHTLSYKQWKCAHEIKEELDTENTTSLETSLFTEFVQKQPEVMLSTIEKYLTSFVDEKVAQAQKRSQNYIQIQQCGLLRQELEYRLLPQEVKKNTGREAGVSGEYRAA